GVADEVSAHLVTAYGSSPPRQCRVAVQPRHPTHGPREVGMPVPLGEGQIAGRLFAVAQGRGPAGTGEVAPYLPQHPPLLLPLCLVSRHDIHGDQYPDHVLALLKPRRSMHLGTTSQAGVPVPPVIRVDRGRGTCAPGDRRASHATGAGVRTAVPGVTNSCSRLPGTAQWPADAATPPGRA